MFQDRQHVSLSTLEAWLIDLFIFMFKNRYFCCSVVVICHAAFTKQVTRLKGDDSFEPLLYSSDLMLLRLLQRHCHSLHLKVYPLPTTPHPNCNRRQICVRLRPDGASESDRRWGGRISVIGPAVTSHAWKDASLKSRGTIRHPIYTWALHVGLYPPMMCGTV